MWPDLPGNAWGHHLCDRMGSRGGTSREEDAQICWCTLTSHVCAQCTHTCTHRNTHIHMDTHMHTCRYMRRSAHTDIYMHTGTRSHRYTQHVCLHMDTGTHLHTCAHRYTQAYIYTQMQTFTQGMWCVHQYTMHRQLNRGEEKSWVEGSKAQVSSKSCPGAPGLLLPMKGPFGARSVVRESVFSP